MSDNSYEQAKAQAESIAAMVAALECDYDRLEELRDERAELAAQVTTDEMPMGEQEMDARNDLVSWDQDNGDELAELEAAAGACESREDAEQRIQEDALEVSIRSGWYSPGETPEPEEFRILLCTGGPAVQIRGELDQYRQPCRAWIEHQDWFEPWQEYHGEGVDSDALLTYCQQFYFGG